MKQNQTGNDIKQGFDAMAGGVKEAGRKRIAEIVSKKGYVAFRNPEAVAQFHADSYYANWNCIFVDGEYRFFPPKDNKQVELDDLGNTLLSNDTEIRNQKQVKIELPQHQQEMEKNPQILDTYKRVIKDPTKTTFIAIRFLHEDSSKCKYELYIIDKRTGEKIKAQEIITDFDGRFSMEVIPSLYNQLADGFPAIDYEKENGITFQNIDNSRVMGFGNLSPEQMQLIKDMKTFVDSRYTKQEQENNGFHR